MTPAPWIAGKFTAQYNLVLDITADGALVADPLVAYVDSGYVDDATPVPFSNQSSASWTNNTGVSRIFGVRAYAIRRLSESSIDWSVKFDIQGGTPGVCSTRVVGSDLFGPNPAFGQQCPPCTGSTSNSVDTRSGNEHYELPGVSVGGRGPGLDFRTGYNSLDAGYDGAMGRGWRNTYDMVLIKDPEGTRTVFQETGSTVTFTQTSPGIWQAPERFNATLVQKPNGSWEFVRQKSQTFTFRAEDGRLAKIGDRNGYETNLVYAAGVLDYVEDTAGRRLDFEWSQGRVTRIVDPLTGPQGPREITMNYSGDDLTGYKDIGGGQWKLTYDAQHRLTSVRTPRFTDAAAHPNKVWQYHYDAQGRVDWEEDPQDRRTEIHYNDPQPGATRVVEPDGDARVDWYDANGTRNKVTYGYGTSDASSTEYEFDTDTGMLTSTTDGRGKVWATQYNDPANPHRATKTIDPLDRERSMTWDADGDLLSVTDAEDVTTRYEYDTHGNLEKTIAAYATPDAAVTDLVYGDAAHPGDVTKAIDARAKEWTYSYAATTGDRLSATDPLGNQTTWQYNNLGWLTSTVSPKGNAAGADPASFRSTITYDKYGAPLEAANAANHKTQIEYDPDGHVTKVTDPSGDVSRNTWTAAGQLATAITGADTAAERTTTFSYDADGRLASWSADPASVWENDWDAQGRLKSQTDPNGEVTHYAYDKTSGLVALTQPGGDCGTTKTRCISYTRDDAGQLTGIDFTEDGANGAMGDIEFTYDNNGHRLTQHIAGSGPAAGTSTWEWTTLGQLKSQTDAAGQEVAYAWDPTGNLKELTYPGQTNPVVYGYDAAGRMNAVTDWTGNHTDFSYDANSNLTQAEYPADTGLVDKWTYDNLDRLDAITWDRAPGQSGGPLGSIDYAHNADGRITQATATGVPSGPTEYAYDSRHQLKTATGGTSTSGAGSYSYDDRGYLVGTPERFNAFDPAGQLERSRPALSVVGTAKMTNALSTTLTMTLPAGVVADDQIFVVATLQANQSVITPPVGYTVVAQDSLASGARIVVYRKTAVGGEATAVVKFSGGAKSLMAIVYRGVDPNDPVATSTTATANDTTSLTVPGPTLPGSGVHLVMVTGGVGNSAALTTTPPGDMTSQIAVDNQGQVASAISDQTFNEEGPVGAKTATFSRVNDAAGVLLALNRKSQTFDYDDRGRRTATTTEAASTTTYSYDQVGQLIGVNGPTGSPSDNLDGYAYDGDGLRIQAPINGQDTHFAWARAPGLPLLLNETAVDGDGDLDPTEVSSYIYGPGGQVLTRLDPQPDITRVGNTSVANASTSTPTIALTLPAGVEADDQILVAVAHNSSATPTVPTGYTDVGTWTNGTTVTRLWRRTATGDEPATLSVTFTNAFLAPKSAVMMVYRGVDPIDPIVDHDGAINTGTTVAIPSLDPTSTKDHVVAFSGSTAPGTNQVWTTPTGFTTRDQAKASGIAILGAERDTDTATATGPITFGFTPSSKLAAVGLVLRQAPAVERWHHGDHLGSTRILTDERGRTVGKASYTPYGKVAESTGETSRIGYAGQYTDPDTGLVYLRARYYDPNTSQFLTRDPLLDLTHEPYGYANNDAINGDDPTGMCAYFCLGAYNAAAAAASDLAFQGIMNVSQGCSFLSNINWGQTAKAGLTGFFVGGATTDLWRLSRAVKSAPTVTSTERLAPHPVKPAEALDRWNRFLGPGTHTDIHPRTGAIDPNRIVSADGRRSIRFGQQEMNSSPTKFHYHEETWSFDASANAWHVENLLVRVPFPKGSW